MTPQRRYIVGSAIAVVACAALILVATLKLFDAPQLGLGQFIVPTLLWTFLSWIAWRLRKGYLRLDDETIERYKLK